MRDEKRHHGSQVRGCPKVVVAVDGGLSRAVLCVLLVAALSACDGLLDVELPGDITEEEVFTPGMMETIVTSAVGKYECAFSTFTASSGDANADAWWRFLGIWDGATEYDERVDDDRCAQGDFAFGWYMPLQEGRSMNETAYDAMSGWTEDEVPGRERLMAISAAFTGLVYQMLGETFCELTVDVGPLMTPEEVLREGEMWFDRALSHLQETGDFSYLATPSLEQLVRLGRARVRLALGDHQGAEDDAEAIQPGFVARITRDVGARSRFNLVHHYHSVSQIATVADQVVAAGDYEVAEIQISDGDFVPFTGYRDLTIDAEGRSTVGGYPVIGEGTPDPRVPVVDRTEESAGMFRQQKYTSASDDQYYAKWSEARYILAEIRFARGEHEVVVDLINAVRDLYDLPHFESDDPQEIWWTLIEERRREHFLEGRFWADKLRLDLWFPEGRGQIPQGHVYRNGTCVLMPQSEYDNNPHLLN